MLRIVVAKPGLDGHDRGAKVVARALRDAGHEVIYTGLHQTPEQIVETAIQEDADMIGLSVLSGAHMTLFRKLIELLAERDASDIVVFGGGIVPEEDFGPLEEIGVAKIFTPGATTTEITGWVAVASRALTPDRTSRAGPAQKASPPTSGSSSLPGASGPVLTVTGCGDVVAGVGDVAAGDHQPDPVPGREALDDAGQLDRHRRGDVGDPHRRDQPVLQLLGAVRRDVVQLGEQHQLAGRSARLCGRGRRGVQAHGELRRTDQRRRPAPARVWCTTRTCPGRRRRRC